MLSLINDVAQICFNCFNSSSEWCALRYDYDINVGRCSAVAIKKKDRGDRGREGEGWEIGRKGKSYPPPKCFCPASYLVRGITRMRVPGIVPCIISFSRQLPCFLMV